MKETILLRMKENEMNKETNDALDQFIQEEGQQEEEPVTDPPFECDENNEICTGRKMSIDVCQ